MLHSMQGPTEPEVIETQTEDKQEGFIVVIGRRRGRGRGKLHDRSYQGLYSFFTKKAEGMEDSSKPRREERVLERLQELKGAISVWREKQNLLATNGKPALETDNEVSLMAAEQGGGCVEILDLDAKIASVD
eukprot:c23451_g1_i4 orf=86-481(+)